MPSGSDMSFGYGFGDALGAARLAWVLYHDCYLVARDAPDEFRNLVNELASLQGILRSLRDEINSDPGYLERVGKERKDAIERTVDGTFYTLKDLQQLVYKFRSLGLSDGINFWKRIKWATQQREIEAFRQKLMVHGTTLNLCMTSIGNATLMQFEQRLTHALHLSGAADVLPEEGVQAISIDPLTTPPPTQPTSPRLPSTQSLPSSPQIGSGSNRQGGQRSNSIATTTTEISGQSSRDYGSHPSSPGTSPPSSSTGSRAQPRTHSAPYKHEVLISTSTKPSYSLAGVSSSHVTNLIDLETPDMTNIELLAAMDEAKDLMFQTRKNRPTNPTYPPLRTVNKKHRVQVSSKLGAEFMEQAGEGRSICPDGFITAKDWLRTATWWLLKSRMIVGLDAERAPNESITSRVNLDLTLRQAHVNLLKACWILYDVVLSDEGMVLSLTDENRAMFLTLEKATIEDYEKFRSAAEADTCEEELLQQSLIIWEHLQPMEERVDGFLENLVEINPSLDPGRWITCDPRNAGVEDEHVLFRCFVNAGVGVRRMRVDTTCAPYLIVLWTKDGESEIKITLCNQDGSLNLTRDFTPDDIQSLPAENGLATGAPPVDLPFPRMPVTVNFLKANDFQQFMAIPGRFFDAVQEREAKEHETLIYRTVVETFERRNPATSGPVNPKVMYSSCELRIYERVGEEGWDRSRRLVITSSAYEPKPWTVSYFLPLSRVQLNGEDADTRYVTVKWSDCSHKTTDTHGTKVNHITYCYDADRPNICVRFSFACSEEAREFIVAILQMQVEPLYTWPKGLIDEQIRSSKFAVRTVHKIWKKYQSLFVVHKKNSWQYGELFHIPREIDFSIHDRRNPDPYAEQTHDNGLDVHIRTVFCTDYISEHVDRPDEPTSTPKFSHCMNRPAPNGVMLDFECLLDAQELLKAITTRWTIRAVRSNVAVSYKTPGFFKRQKEAQAEVSIWERSLPSSSERTENYERRILIRWKNSSADSKWITGTIISASYPPLSASMTRNFTGTYPESVGPGSATALIPVSHVVRGGRIDIVDMKALGGKPKEMSDLRISFSSARDKESFSRDCSMTL